MKVAAIKEVIGCGLVVTDKLVCSWSVATSFQDSQSIRPHGPIGGNAVSHGVTYDIRLSTYNQLIHYATIVKSPYHPLNSTAFYINTKGVADY
jgi:hypothetical protein